MLKNEFDQLSKYFVEILLMIYQSYIKMMIYKIDLAKYELA